MDKRNNIIQELNELNSKLADIPPENVYQVPDGYFDELDKRILNLVKAEEAKNATDELAYLSPLLGSMSKEMPLKVPDGYFENLHKEVSNSLKKSETKIISFVHRTWLRYAVAAAVTGVIFISVFFFLTRKQAVDPAKNPDAWIAKNVQKINAGQIDDFITLSDNELPVKETITPTIDGEIRELVKQIPEKDIQEFLNDTDEGDESGNTTLLN